MLVCRCNGVFDGEFCNRHDRGPGPEPPKAPANEICYGGVGDFNGQTVAFRVDIEDKGEPGRDDTYRIRIWIPTGSETTKSLVAQACCKNKVPIIRTPDVDDRDDTLTGGNFQIHPATPNSVRGRCPIQGMCPAGD